MEKILERLGLSTKVADPKTLDETIARFREQKMVLPTFKELANPKLIDPKIREKLKSVDPDAPDPLNLYRVHWFNSRDRKDFVEVPVHITIGKEITGIDTPILVLAGALLPMIECHKVLAAYACLAPRVILGAFNPTKHRAIWPSTGNYCRGGVAISRLMACRGVAILPEGMSQERFNWLNEWCTNPAEDIIATYGCESNVKEIYDKCNELSENEENFILNQFAEFNNHLAHYLCTGQAFESVFEHYKKSNPNAKLRAFVSATGSAGTIGAGDYLKERYGSKIVAVEAVECPTLLYNGYGDHNIQGIGDKHVPLVHNVMNTDFVCGISEQVSNHIYTLCNTDVGREYLSTRRGLDSARFDDLELLGLSGYANIFSAVKTAKYMNLGKDDVIVTVATDGARMYSSEKDLCIERSFGGNFGMLEAAETFGQYALATATDHFIELNQRDRERVFNLGYFTWCEQQGVDVEAFSARKDQALWQKMRSYVPEWDKMIEDFNRRVNA
ncbi:MAG: pyridoxal-phosphate dependent enzyme [Bradymonadales bacterium]